MALEILDKLAGIEQRYEELTRLFMEVGDDYQRAAELNKERIDLEPIVSLAQNYRQALDRVEEARTLLDGDDLELRMLAEAEILDLEPQIQKTLKQRYAPSAIIRRLPSAAAQLAMFGAGLPRRLDRIVKSVERGEFQVRADVSGLELHIHHIERVINRAVIGNPYLQWLLLGCHRSALPYALRPENFDAIRGNLDRLDCRVQSLEEFMETPEASDLDGFNLSDIFEYMSEANTHRLLEKLIDRGRKGARLVYWNLLAPRRRPQSLAHRLRPLEDLAAGLLRTDKAFFYSALNVEEVL